MLHIGRMVADGIPYSDVEEALGQIATPDDWFEFWTARCDAYEALGTRALEQGHTLSGGEWLWLACLCVHYAQFMLFDDPARREIGQRRKVDLYNRAAPRFRPPAERVEIRFEQQTIPGFLRLPPAAPAAGAPCVVLIGGVESTKEESFLFENLCLSRGLATFAFDGPGQGEMFFETKLRPDFERYTAAVVDYLVERPLLDPTRIGVLGRSLGGHYALRSAAYDRRLKACVAWGFFHDWDEFDSIHELTQRGLAYIAGFDNVEEARPHIRRLFDLGDVAAQVSVPTLLINGRKDPLFSVEQMQRVVQALVNAQKDVVIDPDGDHCCHNAAQIVRPQIADWLADKLGARGERQAGSARA
jgi:2,6-dihydroxypseudooxynicotine hydrolase